MDAKILFISSSSRFQLPEKRSVYRKKWAALSKIGDMSYIAVSDDGHGKCGRMGGVRLCLAPRTGFKLLDVLLFLCFAFKKGLETIKGKDINIIYAQSPLLDGVVGCVLKGLTGCKLVVGVHGDWENEIKYSKPGVARFMPLINFTAERVLENADAVRAISKATKERALEFVPKGRVFSELFPAHFDVDFFLDGEPKKIKDNSAVFVGSLIGRKGVDYLLKAVPEVVERFPDFKLYIIGNGSMGGELKSLSRKLGIEENIEFEGHQPAKGVKARIDECAALVLPSLSEGLGRIALEAMARGKPVIGSQVEGIKETVTKERGYPVPPKDSKALAEALLQVLGDKKAAVEKGKNGREHVMKEYSLEKYVKNHEKLFKFALAR